MAMHPKPNHPTRRLSSSMQTCRRAGFSLLEVVISALLIGVLIVPALSVFGSITRSYALRGHQATADSLAQDLLSEIVQLRFDDPDPITRTFGPEDAESTRADFNDVDDYANLLEEPPTHRDGTDLDRVDDFTRSVTIEFVNVDDPAQVESNETELKRIRVQVDSPRLSSPVTLFALRARTSPQDTDPTRAKTVTRRVDLQLSTGELPVLQTGMNLLNESIE